MNWQQLVYDVILALVPVLAAALITLIGAVFSYVRARYRWMEESLAIQQAENTLYALVQEANQEFVDAIKAAREDGKLTPEEAEEIKQRVMARFIATLTRERYELLRAIVGDLERWLSAKVEEMVVRAKLEKAGVPFSS